MTAVNSLGSQNGRHSRVRYSRSGEQNDLTFTFTLNHLADAFIQSDLQLGQNTLTECMLLSSHHELLIKKQTPPPLLFPVNSFILSTRCTENLESSMAESVIFTDSHVSVRQIMQQSLVSH